MSWRETLDWRRMSLANSSGWPCREKIEQQNWRMMDIPNYSGWPWRRTMKEKQDWRRLPHRSGWPWRQRKKEEHKEMDLILYLFSKHIFFKE